jgi:hypothetical protein
MKSNGMKVSIASAALAVGIFFAGAVFAQVLDFEGLKDQEAVLNYYSGGLGGGGSGPGPNFGITFTPNSMAIIESDFGGSGNFKGEPSPKTILFFLSGPAATMNVPAGFSTGFSFFYSAASSPGVIRVWSGLNATGVLLATLNLPATGSGAAIPACNAKTFCPFFPFGVTFSGVAQSVDFGGTINQIGFDQVTLGSSNPGGGGNGPPSTIPTLNEWAVLTLIGLLAIAGLFAIRRGQALG